MNLLHFECFNLPETIKLSGYAIEVPHFKVFQPPTVPCGRIVCYCFSLMTLKHRIRRVRRAHASRAVVDFSAGKLV